MNNTRIAGVIVGLGLIAAALTINVWYSKRASTAVGQAVLASPFSPTPKNASGQASRMAAALATHPKCDQFRVAYQAAGQGSPYEGKTANEFIRIQRAADAAGCLH